jgi:diguanylate cyclase (GGDEF)-like protein
MLLSNKVVSLRHYLSRWILLVVLLMGLSMIVASYFSGLQSIQQSVTVLSQQISSHVAVRLDRFFGGIVSLVQINQQALNSGLLTFDDKEALQQQFISQVAFVPYVTFVSAADISGEYTGATRTPDTGGLQIMTSYLSDEHQMCVYQVDADNQRGALILHDLTFDALSRSWYQQAVAQQKLSWYPVYKYQPYESMGVGVVAPIFNRQTGFFNGVVTVDLALDRVSHFLRQLAIGEHGVVFLVDDQGRLAASSLDAAVYKMETGRAEQYRLSTYPDARLQAVAEITQPQGQFQVQIDGKDYVLHKQLIQDDHGLYFIVGVLLATADFTAELYSELFLQLALLFLLVIFSLALLRYLIGFIAKPVEQLQHQVDVLANAKWGASPVNSGHILELNALAAAVNNMSDHLHTAFLSREQTIAERTAALQVANEQLLLLSNTDALTQLVNRRGFETRYALMCSLAQRAGLSLTVLMLDIDFFKQYNDHYGHVAGDVCLATVAASIQSQVPRQSDLVARYGGEEFVVVLYDADVKIIESIAQAIVDAVYQLALPHTLSPFSVVTVSIGVARWHSDREVDIAQLVEQADKALYLAKAQGRNGFVLADDTNHNIQ